VFVGVHAANLAIVAALPLWAHRVTSGGLGRLPVEHQMRRTNPMPTISAVVLPVLTVYVLTMRTDDRWAVAYLAGVLLVVIVLNALRHAMLSREASLLSGELAGMAEERRQLLASMVRALDDDRRRTVAELHTQAVGSLSTLGTVVQTACVSLPPATATVVRETIAQLQGDLTNRAEELRMLMVAMRPPSFGEPGGTRRRPGGADSEAAAGADARSTPGRSEDALSAALRAYASDLCAERTAATHPDVHIEVDPRLELDRSTMTIVYRVTQEALLNAVRHAEAERVTVAVAADPHICGAIAVEVADDGVGFDTATTAEGTGLASIRLFTDLGRGEVTLRSAPGEGTVVRSLLGVHDTRARSFASAGGGASSPGGDAGAGAVRDDIAPSASRPGRRHLRLIPPADVSPHPT
jgi:signal transduction histidine kinase